MSDQPAKQPTEAEISKAAAFGFATACASPAYGLSEEEVQRRTSHYTQILEKRAARHQRVRGLIEEFLGKGERPAAV